MIFAIAAAVFCSCDKNADCVPCEETNENGTLAISLLFDETTPTKAVTAYTTSQTYEKQVNNVQVFIFDEDGKVNIYKDAGTTQSNIAISTTTGKKTVWAVVNGPDLSNVASLSELEDVAVDLAANSTTASNGFLMAGSTSCTVSTTSTTANVSVSRLVARVALQKVVNKLPEGYGTITINNVVLSNVVGNQNIAGDAAAATWYNKMGRKDGATDASQIIDGTKYYYPVTLNKKLERNKAYTVEMTITGLGSTDPDEPIVKGSFTASITVQDWVAGESYEEIL